MLRGTRFENLEIRPGRLKARSIALTSPTFRSIPRPVYERPSGVPRLFCPLGVHVPNGSDGFRSDGFRLET